MKRYKEILATFLIDKFEALVEQQPRKAMVIFEDCVYTYEYMDQQANRVANMMRGLGVKMGDTVAMMINNEPAFIWTQLGELFNVTCYDGKKKRKKLITKQNKIIHFIVPFGKFGPLTWVGLQQPQEQHDPVLQVHAGSFRISVIHRTRHGLQDL